MHLLECREIAEARCCKQITPPTPAETNINLRLAPGAAPSATPKSQPSPAGRQANPSLLVVLLSVLGDFSYPAGRFSRLAQATEL